MIPYFSTETLTQVLKERVCQSRLNTKQKQTGTRKNEKQKKWLDEDNNDGVGIRVIGRVRVRVIRVRVIRRVKD